MPLVYSFVARDTTVLAEYSAYAGNFHTVALECLENLQRLEEKFTITCDTYTFNYLVDGNNFSKCGSDVLGCSRSAQWPIAIAVVRALALAARETLLGVVC